MVAAACTRRSRVPRALSAAREPLEPSSPSQVVLASVVLLLLAGAAGFGWTRWAGLDLPAAVAVAPAVGVAVLAIAGVASEPLGLPLSGSVGPTICALLAGGIGYVLLILRPATIPPPSPSVDEQPGGEHDHDRRDHVVPDQ